MGFALRPSRCSALAVNARTSPYGKSSATIKRSMSLVAVSDALATEPYTNASLVRSPTGSRAARNTSATPKVFLTIARSSSKIGLV
jgi:hypothetical protein